MRLTFEDYILDVARRELWRGPQRVAIEPQVFDLLAHLVQNPERVVCRDELLREVWDGRIVSDSAIANRINVARRAIGDSGDAQRLIRTVPRKGFRFIAVVEECRTEAKASVPPPRAFSLRHFPSSLAAAALMLLSVALAVLVLWPGIGSPWVRSGAQPMVSNALPGGVPRLSLAVLPLASLGRSADQPNLADGVTENLTAELSRYTDLEVTSRQTAAALQLKALGAREIGRQLPVRYIVDGSIEQIGGQVRVTTRLADAETGKYIWADRYDRPSTDLMEVEDEIIGRTVHGVRRALTFSEANRPTSDPDAAQLVWRGSAQSLLATSRKSLDANAKPLFEQAMVMAPGLVPAKFSLAHVLAITAHGLFNANDDTKLKRAAELADAALAQWPNDSATHFTKGLVLRLQGDCADAIPEFERTIAIDRYYTAAYSRLAYCKFMTGQFGDVATLEDRAIRLDALGYGLMENYRRIGMVEMLEAHVDQAVFWLEKSRVAIAIRPSEGGYETYTDLAAAYALNGDIDRAADALAEARKTPEFPASVAQLRRQSPLCLDPKVKEMAEATYFKGLRLAGLSEE
jgi:TolB-like protein/DNA-binding winged helix-turn-helix (wHTH) protein